jgi:hypothetical protein
MRPAASGNVQTETSRFEKPAQVLRPQDFLKLIEELRALKSRSNTLDLQRLEEAQRMAVESAMKAAEKRFKPGGPDTLQKLQSEERRIAEAKFDQDKGLLASKYQKLDHGLLSLAQFISGLGPVKELEISLAEKAAALKKSEDELNVQRKVFAHEQDELEREKKLLEAAEQGLRAKEKDLDARLANLDVVRRAKELDLLKKETDLKLAAFQEQEQRISRERDAINLDFEKLGEKRAEMDNEAEKIAQLSAALAGQKAKMADTVAKEMAATFEAFVRDMLRPPPEQPSEE